MPRELATTQLPPTASIIEKVMMEGDLSGLTSDQRLTYYKSVCDALRLNPLTKPFDYIILDGKLTLYATKDCAAQLRKRNRISIKILSRERQDDVYVVVAEATMLSTSGAASRTDESIGAVPLTVVRDGNVYPLVAKEIANAIMKAETKAKRRVTLSVCGLGVLDESEIDDLDQRRSVERTNEIAERNVKTATANATGEPILSPAIKLDGGEVTRENYKNVVVHVGKDDGMKWKKVGELDAKVVKWMHENWRNNLRPNASPEDLRLKKAIEFAYEELSTAVGAEQKADAVSKTAPTAAQPSAKDAAIEDLLGRIQDLVLTEEQAVGFCIEQGIANTGWVRFDQMDERILLHLCTPIGWSTFKGIVEQSVKPKPKEKGRKKT